MTRPKRKPMRRSPIIFGAAALLVVIVAAAIGVRVIDHRWNALDVESKAFVDRTVPAIAANWSDEQLLDLSTPQLRDELRPDDLTALSNGFSQLGRFWQYLGATGKVTMPYMPDFIGSMSASYMARASFAEGIATYQMTLVKRHGRWMISKFHVDVEWFGPLGLDFGCAVGDAAPPTSRQGCAAGIG